MPTICKLLKVLESKIKIIANPKFKKHKNKLALKCVKPEFIKTWCIWLLSGWKGLCLFIKRTPITLKVSNRGIKKMAPIKTRLFCGLKACAFNNGASVDKNFKDKNPIQNPIINDPVSPMNTLLVFDKLYLRYPNKMPVKHKLSKK